MASKVQQAKKALKEDGKKLSKNKDNPVLIGNAVIWGIATVAIGYGAYRKHSEGKLDWKLAGAVTGIIGGFSVVDYFGSKYVAKPLPLMNPAALIRVDGCLRTSSLSSRQATGGNDRAFTVEV